MSIEVSVIIPEYMGKPMLQELYTRLKDSLESITERFEVILVNDGSPDNLWEDILMICHQDNRFKGINLSRNFGQHYAITAGLSKSSGRWVVIMDCDLQDRPEEIPRLYTYAQSANLDIVHAQRILRQDSPFKKTFSKFFYRTLGFLTDTTQDPSIGNFGIYHHNVIKSVLSMGDQIRYFPTMVKWVGFRSGTMEVEHSKRSEGKTSYSFHKLMNLAINVILSFSDKPLKIVAVTGLVMSLLSVCFALITLIRYFTIGISVIGWSSLIISIWFLAGIVLTVLGIIGLYIGRTFEKVKNRPLFLILDMVNLD